MYRDKELSRGALRTSAPESRLPKNPDVPRTRVMHVV